MPRSLKARVTSLAELLSSGRRIVAPEFQRPYAWSDEMAATLLADIREAQAEAAESEDGEAQYLLGSITLVNAVGDAVATLVDGQQRLTTLTILLAVLRDLDDEQPEAIDRFIRAKGPGGDRLRPIFAPRPRDAVFFEEAVQRPGATRALDPTTQTENDAQAAMLAAALALRDLVQEIPARERIWFAEFALRTCCFVEVSAPRKETAIKVFLRLHDRGARLDEIDILKAELLSATPPALRDRFAQRWESLEADLGRTLFNQLFSHIRMIHSARKARDSVVTELRALLTPERDAMGFLETIVAPMARLLRELGQAQVRASANAVEINRHLRALGRLPRADWLPAAMAFWAERKPTGDDGLAFIRAFERMCYALTIQTPDENVRRSRFSRVITLAREGAPLEDILAVLDLSPREKAQTRQVLGGAIYGKERIRKIVLLRIDEALSETSATYDLEDVTVEHVLPRNPPPGSWWAEKWPDANDRKKWTDRLGNLALLSRRSNDAAANFDFTRKKQEYFARGGVTPFAITTQVLMVDDWTPKAVEKRQAALVAAACALWDL